MAWLGAQVQSPEWTESSERRKLAFWYNSTAKNISLPGTAGNARECFMVCLFVGQFQRNLDVESLKNTLECKEVVGGKITHNPISQ